MKANELLFEFYHPEDDELDVMKLNDTRRPRLTLLHIQRLRKSRDAERLDRAQHLELLPDMYAPMPDMSAGGGM
jgi:hypothetical protein